MTKLASSPTSARTACSTCSAWCPTMAIIERGSSACAALDTCAISGKPPSSCRTFARFDFIRVPRPAAMIRMFSGFDDVVFSDKENLSHCNRRYRLFPTVEHDLSEPSGVVSHFFAVVQQVGADDLRPLIYCVIERTCDADLVSTFSGVKLSLLFADSAVVDDNKIEVNLRRVLLDRLEVLSRAV